MGANAQTSVPLFASGEVLTAANQNLSAGTGVPVFATTATRDAAFGGAGEKVLAEGQLCYIEAAPKRFQVYNGTAFVDYFAEWTTWTPTYAGFTVGNATVVARYIEIGKYGHAYVSIILGSTSSVSAVTAMTISNPSTMAFAANGVTTPIGQCELRDTGTNSFSGIVGYASATTVQPRNFAVSGSLISEATSVTSTGPFTWTTGDIIWAQWFYQKA